jgi:hypothetical protein
VNPRTRRHGRRQGNLLTKVKSVYGAAVSRLEPVIRACEATEDVRGWFLLVQAFPVWWATPYEESQHPRTEAKAAGRAGSPAGHLPTKRKGMRQRTRSTEAREANRNAHLSRFQAARTDLDRAGSHTER